MIQDARCAVRRLRRDRTLAAAVILTLAIAIGMNTAILSVFNAVVLRPLAYPHPDRLVWLATIGPEEEHGFVTGPDFAQWRDDARSFERMAAYAAVDYTLASTNGAARVRTALVSEDFWDLSGARPAAGRLPLPGEQDVLLISSAFARRWFSGGSDVVGHPVTLNGRRMAIVGVLPEHFRFHFPAADRRAGDVDVYEPMLVSSERGGPVALLNVTGRLKAGATLAGARVEIETIRGRIARAHPNPFDDQRTLCLVPLHEQLVGRAGWALRVMLGAALFVLLIACANVASLLLARAAARRQELAIRLSLGASRARVLRQLLVESLVLAVLGSTAGVLIASLGVASIVHIDPFAMPRLAEATIDGRILAVVLGSSVLTALALGVSPALALWKTYPHDTLRGSRLTMGPAQARARARTVLVACEVALALTLLIGAGLMTKSAWRMHAYASGFEPERVLTARIELAGPQYAEAWQSVAFADALLDRLRAGPGVEAASISTHGYMLSPGLMVEGEPEPTADELAGSPPLMINATSAALEQVMGFRMLRGRWFTDGAAEAVLNGSLARRGMDGRDPVGRRIRISENGPLLTIVGVAEDLRYSQLDAPAVPEVYIPFRRVDDGLIGFTALILMATEPRAFAPAFRQLVAEIDPTQVPDRVTTLDQRLADSIAPRRLNLFLLSVFAASALILSMTGIYGLLSYSVTERLHEIGVRMALGARRIDIVRMIVGQGMGVTVLGIIAGVIGALVLTRLMESLLYDVRPTDPWTFAAVAAILAMTGLLACCLPALKGAYVDPANILRDE